MRIVQEWKMAVQFLTRIPWPESKKSSAPKPSAGATATGTTVTGTDGAGQPAALAACLQGLAAEPEPFDETAFVRSVRWYPYVGLLIGGILAGLAYVLYRWLPLPVAAVLLVVAEIGLTGGLHLDGLMDTADGLLSGRDRERKLAIMKDSRTGPMGVITFVCLFALKWALFTAGTPDFSWLLLLMPAVGRFAMVWAVAHYPSARPEGMGAVLADRVPFAQVAFAGLVLIVPLLLWQVRGFVILCFCWLVAWWFIRRLNRALGGLTGDTYGAVCEVTEVVFLLAGTAILA